MSKTKIYSNKLFIIVFSILLLSIIVWFTQSSNKNKDICKSFSQLVFDLDNNGIQTVKESTSWSFFDLNGNSIANRIGWSDGNDGFLVIDKNSNGKIDSGNEVFGNFTKLKNNAKANNGFEALTEYDINHDGVINNDDSSFNDLMMWIDHNQNGKSHIKELKTLKELGIESINLGFEINGKTINGNYYGAQSTFIQNGEAKPMINVCFSYSNIITEYTKKYDITMDTLTLPWLRGYGSIKDLHIEYSLNSELAPFVKSIKKDIFTIDENFDTLLKKWTGLETLHKDSGIQRDELSIDDKVWLLESFWGMNNMKESIEKAIANNTTLEYAYDIDYINEHFNNFREKYFIYFYTQALFTKALKGATYNINKDQFKVKDKKRLNHSIIQFMNNTSNPIDIEYFSEAISLLKWQLSLNKQEIMHHITNESAKDYLNKAFDKFIDNSKREFKGVKGNDKQ